MKRKKMIKAGSISSILIFSVAGGLIVAVILILFSSFLLVKNDISHSLIRYFWILIYFVSGAVSGLVAGKRARAKGFLWGSAGAFICSCIIFLISAILLKFNFDVYMVILVPISVVSGLFCGIISSNIK